MDGPTPASTPATEPEGAAYELFWQCLDADEPVETREVDDDAEGEAYVRFWELSDV